MNVWSEIALVLTRSASLHCLLQALRRPQLEKSMQMVNAREDDPIASEIEWLGLERDEGFLPLIGSTCETSECRQW